MSKQFDVEEKIMDCWNITNDLDVLNEAVLESNISSDQISNVLCGLKQLYQLKFEKLFKDYESLLKEYYSYESISKENTHDSLHSNPVKANKKAEGKAKAGVGKAAAKVWCSENL